MAVAFMKGQFDSSVNDKLCVIAGEAMVFFKRNMECKQHEQFPNRAFTIEHLQQTFTIDIISTWKNIKLIGVFLSYLWQLIQSMQLLQKAKISPFYISLEPLWGNILEYEVFNTYQI